MNHSSTFEWALIAFILIGIGFAVWRAGQANPEGTGKLRREFEARLEQETKDIGSKLGEVDGKVMRVKDRLVRIETDVEEIKAEAATVKDIARLEERIAGHHQLAQQTNKSVERIERMLIEKGLGK